MMYKSIMTQVAAGIFIKNNKVLIAQRDKHRSLPGFWEFPGGKQEAGETIFACLEREIFEEFQVVCKAHTILTEDVYAYDHDSINLIAIIADLLDEHITLTVHETYQWVEAERLLDFNLAPADIPAAKKLVSILVKSTK